MSEIRLLAAPVIVKDGRITISTFIIEILETNGHIVSHKQGEPIVIHLDPSKEPKFSPHPAGGWCSPPYTQIEEAEKAGIELDDVQIIKCKCHKEVTEEPAFIEQDLRSLEQYGHKHLCPKKVVKSPLVSENKEHRIESKIGGSFYVDGEGNRFLIDNDGFLHKIKNFSAPPLPGQLDSIGAADAKNSPVKSVPDPPKSAPVPPGGLDENALDNLVQALVGSTETISAGLNQLRLKPASYDHQTIATQLVRYASCTQCVKCGTWAQVSNINNPRCAHYPNCGA